MISQKFRLSLCALILFMSQIQAQTSTVMVDFGSIASEAPWNNLSAQRTGVLNNMTDSLGVPTNMMLEVFDAFNGINTNGIQNPHPSLGIPGTATGDSFYGNTVSFSGSTEPTGGIRLSGLNTENEYTLTVFASRIASDNRETQYICTGSNQQTSYLNVASNSFSVVTFTDLPSAEGTLEILASPGPSNNNSYGFFYFGAMIVRYPSGPIPDPELYVMQPNGGEFWQVGKTVETKWVSSTRVSTNLEYSIDSGSNWTNLGSFPAYQKSFEWTVPDSPSQQCLVRVTSDTLSDSSDGTFEISSETGSRTVVVIGSSTAAGTGTSTLDSAWVYRLQNHVYGQDTRNEVLNLALGGYSTYQLLPTGSTAGTAVGIAVDTERNITKALSFNPTGIVINLPSNDAASNYPVSAQLENFAAMVETADAQDVAVWICTTQPRNFSNPAQIQIQRDVRDSIFSIYGEFAIDFWNGLAGTDGHILDDFDAGDGVHLNDQAHRILYERVLDAVSWSDTVVSIAPMDALQLQPVELPVRLFPNPFNSGTRLEFILPVDGDVEITIFNIMGQEVMTLAKSHFCAGRHDVALNGLDKNGGLIDSGTYFLHIRAGEYSTVKKGIILK